MSHMSQEENDSIRLDISDKLCKTCKITLKNHNTFYHASRCLQTEFRKKSNRTDLSTPTMARLSQTLVICGSFPLIRELNVADNWYFHNLAAFPPANSSVFAAASLEVTISSYLFPGRNLPTYLPACLSWNVSRAKRRFAVVELLSIRFCDIWFLLCMEFNKRRAPINQMTYVLF